MTKTELSEIETMSSRPTVSLRWHDGRLQQAFIVEVQDARGFVKHSVLDWQDVPSEKPEGVEPIAPTEPDTDPGKILAAIIEALGPGTSDPVERVKALVEFRAKVTEAAGLLNAGHDDVCLLINGLRKESADLRHAFRVLARDATAEREAWVQNAKAATGGKVENPRQLDAYIDGLKHKLSEVAKIVHGVPLRGQNG